MTVGETSTEGAPAPAEDDAPDDPGTPVPAAAEVGAGEPPDGSAADLLAAVLVELTALRTRLDELTEQRRRDEARAEAREKVIAHQRDELDALRAERRGTHLRPLVVSLQKLRAELLAEVDDLAPDATHGLAASFTYYADDVAALLERCGVERLPTEAGELFDPALHTATRSVEVDAPQHRRILTVVSEGWAETTSGRVLAPAKVVVGRHIRTDRTDQEEPTDG